MSGNCELAGPRGLLLMHANELVRQARAKAALQRVAEAWTMLRMHYFMARRCEPVCAWAERDAAELIAQLSMDPPQIREMQVLAESWEPKLRLPDGYVWPPAKCWQGFANEEMYPNS